MYTLVNIQKTLENHHVSWVNQLFLWPCSIVMLVYQGVHDLDAIGNSDLTIPSAGPSWPSSWLKRDVAASRWILIIKLRSRTHFSMSKKSKYINIPWSRHSQLVFVCIYVLNTYIYISLSYIHRTNLSLEGSLQLPGIPCTWLWNHCWREETVKTTGFLW